MIIMIFIFFLWSFQAAALAESSYSAEFSSMHSESLPQYTLAKNTLRGQRRRALMFQQSQLNRALNFIKNRNYLEGVRKLFLLSQKPALEKQRAEIRFVLGKTFMELKLFHAAAFQFISVIETGNRQYIKRSLKNLSLIASLIGDRKMLQFAIEKRRGKKLTRTIPRLSLLPIWKI